MLSLNNKFEILGALGDGERAAEIARDKRPNIMLLDINMVPVNGFDVLKRVRKLSPATKIIGVSMHAQPAYAKKMIRGGAKGYVTKNSPSSELLKAIEVVLQGKIYVCEEVKSILLEKEISNGEESNNINTLSERELELIGFMRDGLSSKEISDKMNISVRTVEVHRHNILRKLKVKNTAALINLINAHGL
jgi:DNA-binding NarL/FixJ family response regulator